MAVRLIEVFLPASRLELANSAVSTLEIISVWSEQLSGGQAQLHVLAEAKHSEAITDALRTALGDSGDSLRMVSLPVEASIPAPEQEEPAKRPRSLRRRTVGRVSREELYADVSEMVDTSVVNLVLTVLSAVVAAVGLARNSVAVIIGAMVIAPLLGPNVGLSLAATLGDFQLGLRALRENFIRIGAGLVFALLVGLVVHVDVGIPEVLSRTSVSSTDLIVALASGAAGALALGTGASVTLIGVMVAAALMPPLVVAGLLAGQGDLHHALGALHLLAVNLVSINLAGVLVFLLMGFRPGGATTNGRSGGASGPAVALLWVALLAVLALLVSTG